MPVVSFLAADLHRWDALEPALIPEALVLPFYADERPLRGAAGLVDWRLCGRLSRLLRGGRVSGALGEVTLYPPPRAAAGPRLPFPRLLLFGLGPQPSGGTSTALETATENAAVALARVVADLGLRRVAVVPPGRSLGRLGARRALELFLGALAGRPHTIEDLVVIESPAGMKEAADLARTPAANP